MSAELSSLRLPPVCIVMPIFKVYDYDQDTMETVSIPSTLPSPLSYRSSELTRYETLVRSQWRGTFEYPLVFQLSDFVAASCTIESPPPKYQLIGWVSLPCHIKIRYQS